MEKRMKIFLVTGLCLVFLQGAFSIVWMTRKGKTAYINTEEIYNSFQMKKKLEGELKKTQDARQFLLDSMRMQINTMSMTIQNMQHPDSAALNRFTDYRNYFFRQQDEFQQANNQLAGQYTNQIWAQLNQYIKDYGHQHGYEYIFGASGDGSLMFADDAVNITDEMKTYVNNRYQGKP